LNLPCLASQAKLESKGNPIMQCLVTINFLPGQQEIIAARMPAEQTHVRELTTQGVINAIYIAADRSRVWLVMQGESTDQIRQTMTDFPLYPVMELNYAPLLEPPASGGAG
jgi:muconolactone delta-isomerase